MPTVIGAIRDKWLALGGATSFLGEPLTDELTCPDGIGKFNHFQGGSIYWTPSTGAQVVFGAIRDRWATIGEERSFLGYPVTDEIDFSEGGRVSVFEHGAIYWWPDTGAIEIGQIFVHYTGLNCFNETSGLGSDEPYVVLGINVPDMPPLALRSNIYSEVDGGDTRPDLIELYRGQPRGMTITAQLMEHDSGNPEDYRVAMEGVAAAASVAATALVKFVPKIGGVLAAAAGPILTLLNPTIGEALGRLLGLGDDIIGKTTIAISPREMVLLAARTENLRERNVNFKIASVNLTGDGGNYKIYFGMSKAP